MSKKITKQFVKQQLKKQPDVDKENPDVELYSSEYRNQNCIPHSTNAKSYIFNGEELFLESYPYSIELSENDLRQNMEDFNFENCRFFEAHEGTLLRVFWISGKWYTATNKKLESINSKWAARTTTFGLHFAEAVKENIRLLEDEEIYEDEEETIEEKKKNAKEYLANIYEANLDKSKKYVFLLEPSHEERIVCLTNAPRFFNIGVFDKDNNLSFDEDVTMNGFVVPKPKELKFNNVRDLLWNLENININEIQGFIAIQSQPDQEDKHYKILNENYKYLFSLRGNTSSIRFRYLELQHQNTTINLAYGTNQQKTKATQKMVEDFIDLYNFKEQAQIVETFIWNICIDLFQKYQCRYMNKRFIDVSVKVNDILEKVHFYFLQSIRINDKRITTPNRIRDILEIQTPTTVNKLLAEYEKIEKDSKRNRILA
jgi:hypothetical protein